MTDHVELTNVPYKNGALTTLADVTGRYALVNLPAGAMLSNDQVLSAELSGKMHSRRILSVPIHTGAFSSTMKAPAEALMTLSARQAEGKEPASFEVIVLRLEQSGGNTSAVVAIKKDDFDKASRLLGSHDVFLAQSWSECRYFADGSTFALEKATISGFATNPTRTFFANARKADRNHEFTFLQPLGSDEIVRANFTL